jgi:hypothetical protein
MPVSPRSRSSPPTRSSMVPPPSKACRSIIRTATPEPHQYQAWDIPAPILKAAEPDCATERGPRPSAGRNAPRSAPVGPGPRPRRPGRPGMADGGGTGNPAASLLCAPASLLCAPLAAKAAAEAVETLLIPGIPVEYAMMQVSETARICGKSRVRTLPWHLGVPKNLRISLVSLSNAT